MLLDCAREFFVKWGGTNTKVVAAVSGGIDSTALLLTLADLRAEGIVLTCAHVNHHLRGGDSDGDEAFVRDLCASLGVPLRVADGTLDREDVRHRGIEGAARAVRYERLQAIRAELGADCIATAHQKNDQAETVLMRLVTGSGIGGLRGIHPVRADGVVRPLLDVSREEIEAFLSARGVEARVDITNSDPRFLRNRIRTIVRDLGAVENLAAVARQAQSHWPTLQRAIDEAERACCSVESDELRIHSLPADTWLLESLLHRHIHRLDPSARDVSAKDIARLADEASAIRRTSVTRLLELTRDGRDLVLRRTPATEAPEAFEIALSPASPAYVAPLGVTVHVAPVVERAAMQSWRGESRQCIQLPEGAAPSFVVRNRRPGDVFQPLGLAQPKKLKDFLIDRKIDAARRDRLPLLVSNGEIAWVPGVEVSERFKVTEPRGAIYEAWIEGGEVDESGEADLAGLRR